MNTTTLDINQQMCDMLQKHNTRNVNIQADTYISKDLNIDSLAVMDLVMELEEKYDIDIPVNLLSDIEKVSDLSALVAIRIRERQ